MLFIFPGQGSQYPGMGRDLYHAFKEAKDVFDEVDDTLGRKLSGIIFGSDKQELSKTSNTQPAIMAVSLALMAVLEKQLGLVMSDKVQFVAGHSLGEYSALAAAKGFTLKQTAQLLDIRGKAMERCNVKGKMIALLDATYDNATLLCDELNDSGVIVVANDNGAGQIVLSGDAETIDKVPDLIKKYNIKKAIALNVTQAFHSPLMKSAMQEMKAALSEVLINKPIVPVIHNTIALANNDIEIIRNELALQVCARVRWRETMQYAIEKGVTQVVEIGPSLVLSNIAKRMFPDLKVSSLDKIDALENLQI